MSWSVKQLVCIFILWTARSLIRDGQTFEPRKFSLHSGLLTQVFHFSDEQWKNTECCQKGLKWKKIIQIDMGKTFSEYKKYSI